MPNQPYVNRSETAPSASITLSHAAAPLRGELTVPGDKSISHRSIMFGALSEGDTRITGFLRGADCLSTIACFRQLGVGIDEGPAEIIVHGKGLHGLCAPAQILDAGNSGTTVRLMAGILAGQPFASTITGDASIQKRPMRRVMTPLSQMGAQLTSLAGNDCAPLSIGQGAALHGITYESPVASAQVKSCVLLAGLYADAPTTVIEPTLSRDHTERMLRGFGAEIASFTVQGETAPTSARYAARICPKPRLHGMEIEVPGDISSAAYFIAAASIVPGSEVLIRNVGVNPTRDGIIRVARDMGADITLLEQREVSGEPVADLLVKYAPLHGVRVEGPIIPTLIDELPVVAVMAACASGTTVIADAAELKVKESDRIAVVSQALQRMGADVVPTDDGMIITGRGNDGSLSALSSPAPLSGAVIDSHADHRIAMSFAVAALAAAGETNIKGAGCVNISYPQFYQQLAGLLR